MNVEDKKLNDHINLLEIKLEKNLSGKSKGGGGGGAQVRAREQWVELGEKIIHTFWDWKRKDKLKSQ